MEVVKATQSRDVFSQLRKQIDDTTSDYDREKLQERLAKLVGGVAVINVGAATEIEMKEKKARVEDALHATRAAVEEGIVPGGGVALVRARIKVKAIKLQNSDEQAGVNIIFESLAAPLKQIVQNAGFEPAVVLAEVEKLAGAHGFNAATGEYCDMEAAGIIDPTKVSRTALQNAASVAGLMLTTEAIIAEKPKDESSKGGAPDMSGMGGMGGMGGMM